MLPDNLQVLDTLVVLLAQDTLVVLLAPDTLSVLEAVDAVKDNLYRLAAVVAVGSLCLGIVCVAMDSPCLRHVGHCFQM